MSIILTLIIVLVCVSAGWFGCSMCMIAKRADEQMAKVMAQAELEEIHNGIH